MWIRKSYLLTIFVFTITIPPCLSGKSKSLFIYEGESKHEAPIIEISKQKYLKINDIAKVYNLSLSFKPVSGKAVLSGFNRKIEFILNSSRYTIGGVRKSLKHPVRVVKNSVYLPVSFLTSEEFSRFTDTETQYIPETSTFIISRVHNIIPPRFYTEPAKTKIVIELTETLPFSHKISDGKVSLEFLRGKVIEESIAINDGVVREIKLANKNRVAIIDIFLTENAISPIVETTERSVRVVVPRSLRTPPVAEVSHEHKTQDVAPSTTTAELSSVITTTQTLSEIHQIQTAPTQTPKKVRIVLDPGHGGEDPGAIGPNGTMEKDVNLAVSRELVRLFEQHNNIEVILTRTDDTFVPLVDRTNLANEKQADLFISIHCNASLKKASGGYEAYFLSEKASDPDAMATQILENSVIELEKKKDIKRTKLQELLWSMIVNEFINESSELCYLTTQEIPKRIKVENRGVKQAGFYVLRGAQMPAILVECAFISNPAEEIKLRNPRVQKQIADGLYVAVMNYLKKRKML